MTVRVEQAGPVTTVIMDRPEARNAVDGPTPVALADAFRSSRRTRRAASLSCADPAARSAPGPTSRRWAARGNRVEPDGDGPMGPTRLRLTKPVIAAISGHAVAGARSRALV